MNRCRLIILLFVISALTAAGQKKAGAISFKAEIYQEIPLGSIKPAGWLHDQLIIMRKGSTGHLDEVHNKIALDNGWQGGKGDGWEQTPYWLDGAVPLAWLLDDAELKSKVLRYINWTIDHQRPSGYFGPVTATERKGGPAPSAESCETGEDWWPKMVMLKVLQQYFEATQDVRVIPFMTKYFNYQLAALKKCPIGNWSAWATSRGTDNEMVIQWLYARTHDKSLLVLARLIEQQSFAWSEWLGNRDWAIGAAVNQTDSNWMRRHAVNVGMALKSPAINYQRTGDKHYLTALQTGWKDLMTLHGLPMGVFSGDEDLHGNEPTQGVELCAIVESMFSLEKIISVTGDVAWMDALERMTFNALPTQTTDDYNNKQYFQVANQVQVSTGVFDFSLPFDRGMNNVFGLRSGYTCCTANMHQGWTKFATHLWYSIPKGGLAALEYAPNTLTTKVNGEDVVIREITSYPFADEVKFEFSLKKQMTMPMQFRIPGWCKKATLLVNGQPDKSGSFFKGGQVVTITRTWSDQDHVTLQLPMEIKTTSWAKNSRAVERGPLVFALKLGERWELGTDEKQGNYYSVYPTEDWNFGLLEENVKSPATQMKATVNALASPFSWNQRNAPVTITAPARKIPEWKLVNGVAHQPVTTREGVYQGVTSQQISFITLIPYGFSKVRIVAFPVVK